MDSVISTVLSRNIAFNVPNLPPTAGNIQVKELDWTVSPGRWVWDHPSVIASGLSSPLAANHKPLLSPFNLIITADTVYDPSLIEPLLRTLHGLATMSIAASATSRIPPVLVCLERRDPALVDRMLSEAHDVWGFDTERIPHRKLAKALERGAGKWDKEDWDGVELWKLRLVRGREEVDDVS